MVERDMERQRLACRVVGVGSGWELDGTQMGRVSAQAGQKHNLEQR